MQDRKPILPIASQRAAITSALKRSQVIVVSGDTGSGKTTQLPQICLEDLNPEGLIGCTQPRRIAATSVAQRVAQERNSTVGREVGFQVRFHDALSKDTRIKFMTDGILLAETRGDRSLKRYEILIVDEAHERSLNIDFLLGYLKTLLPRRPDLKIIISSATLDTDRFSAFFDNAPIISIEGRTFPVEDHSSPPLNDDEDLPSHVLRAVHWIREIDRQGDILIFLPGEREIRETTDILEGQRFPSTLIVPLFARLGFKEQQLAFETSRSEQRIVLATNVAETSLTIPGIVYVIDSGLARISRYHARSRVQRLQIEPISQASARQRRGRCGRVREGICLRLYSEEDYESRPPFTDPEIRRTSLAGVILQMKSLGLPPVETFPLIDPPQKKLVTEGYRTLQDLAALDEDRELTQVGREMARFPIDPALARMLIYARDHKAAHVLNDLIVVTAALTVQDCRERPFEKQQQADQAHAQWRDRQSDFLGHLRLWGELAPMLIGNKRQNALRRFCHKNYLNFRRILEWHRVQQEIATLLKIKLTAREGRTVEEVDSVALHTCILAGLPRGAAQATEGRAYRSGSDQLFYLFPGSGLFARKKQPPWIVAFEIVETSKYYARQAGVIQPEWLEKAAPHLCRYRYSDPYWDRQQGAVYAREHVMCGGLKIIADRPVHFGRINPVEARKTFIREALVTGDLTTSGAFRQHNIDVIEEVRLREQKIRRLDSLLCLEAAFEFFDAALPEGICTTKAFEKWRHDAEAANPHILFLTPEQASYPTLDAYVEEDYPDERVHEGLAYPLYYKCAPDEPDDGLTLGCGIDCLEALPDWLGGWLVPGYLKEKVSLIFRSLPKNIRRDLGSPEEAAIRFVDTHQPQGRLSEKLAAFIRTSAGHHFEPTDFRIESLPDHLRVTYWIGDEEGKEIAVSKDLSHLKSKLKIRVAQLFDRRTRTWEENGLKTWPPTMDPLPERIDLSETEGASMESFPSLVDEGETVGVRLWPSLDIAHRQHRLGLIRLATPKLGREIDYLKKHLPLSTSSRLQLPMLGHGGRQNPTDFLNLILDHAISGGKATPLIRDSASLNSKVESLRGELFPIARELAGYVDQFIAEYDTIARAVEQNRSGPYAANFKDIAAQIDQLFMPRFFLLGGSHWISRYPIWFRSIRLRIERMLGNPPLKDLQKQERVMPFMKSWKSLFETWETRPLDLPNPVLEFATQLHEFRLTLFTPEIRPLEKVSEKRLELAWEALAKN